MTVEPVTVHETLVALITGAMPKTHKEFGVGG
jgi:hypothetical protein